MGAIERLLIASDAAKDNGQPQPEQTVADDRPGQLRFHDVGFAGREDEEGEDQFRGVPERHVQQSANGRACPFGEVFRGAADPLGKGDHR